MTVSISDAPFKITVSFSTITTITTIQLDPSTVANSDPSATPTLSFPLAYNLGSVSVKSSTTYINNKGQEVPLAVDQEVGLNESDDTPHTLKHKARSDSDTSGSDTSGSGTSGSDTSDNNDLGEIEIENGEAGNGGPPVCYRPFLTVPASEPDKPFDIFGCNDDEEMYLELAFADAKVIADRNLKMTPDSKA